MPRRHTRADAIAAINVVIAELEKRVEEDRAKGITVSPYAAGVKYGEEALEHIKTLEPGRVYFAGWGMFDRYVADAMPWDEKLLKTIHDAQRIVRIYLKV